MEGVADYSGWVNKLSSKGFWKGSWKRKWAMLKGEALYLYKSPSDKTSRCYHISSFTTVKRVTHKGRLFCIEMSSPPSYSSSSSNTNNPNTNNPSSSSSGVNPSTPPSSTYSSSPSSSSAPHVVSHPKRLCLECDSKEELRKWAALFRAAVKDKALDMSLADRTGWLAVLGGKKMTKTWKRRWVVAQYSTLYLFKDEASAATSLPSSVIDLSEYSKATVVESARSGRPHTFHITTSHPTGTTHFLSALSENDLHDWLNFVTPLLQTSYSPVEDIRAEVNDENNFYVAPTDSHFSIPSSSRPDFRILALDHGHFATAWKELLVGHDPEGVMTWRIAGWGRVVTTSPDRSLLVATGGKSRQWAIFEAVAGEMVGSPVDYTDWLYSLAWLSSGRYIAASSMSAVYLFSVDGRLLKSWTRLKPNGSLVELSSLRKTQSAPNNSSSSTSSSDIDEGYAMQVHCVAALRGDLVAVSEPSSNSVWIADLQRGSVLQTIDFDSPLDLTVTRQGRTVVLGVDGRRHVGVITIHRHHASRSSGASDRQASVVLNSHNPNHPGGRGLKSSSDFSIGDKGSSGARAALTSSSETDNGAKKSAEVLKLPLPGGAGVRVIGNDTILTWKPLVHVSPSNSHMLVNDRTGLLWLFDIRPNGSINLNTPTNSHNPPRPLGRSVLGYVQDVLWLSEDAFLAITNNRTLFKVDLLLDAVVFSRCIL